MVIRYEQQNSFPTNRLWVTMCPRVKVWKRQKSELMRTTARSTGDLTGSLLLFGQQQCAFVQCKEVRAFKLALALAHLFLFLIALYWISHPLMNSLFFHQILTSLFLLACFASSGANPTPGEPKWHRNKITSPRKSKKLRETERKKLNDKKLNASNIMFRHGGARHVTPVNVTHSVRQRVKRGFAVMWPSYFDKESNE